MNTRSLTEAELVGMDDTIGFIKWISRFLKFKVDKYPVDHPLKKLGTKNIVKQDKTSIQIPSR